MHVVHNQLDTDNHWIGVRLPLDRPDYPPFGAMVWVHALGGSQCLPVVSGDSYKAQHPTSRHFGLGKETNVKAIEVQWVNGKVTRLNKPRADRYHTINP